MTARPISVRIVALGGQGGGLLAGWLAEAAWRAGYPAQATSIPGLAQRTGATSYYFELFLGRDPDRRPVFSLFPGADDVDLVAALEPMEAGRALGDGQITKRTTVITARERVLGVSEQIVAGDGTTAVAPLLEALAGARKSLNQLDLGPQAAKAGG